MNVHTWIETDLQSVRSKFWDSVLSVVPRQRWVDQVDDGGSSITHLLLHVARHQDLAVTTAIRNQEPLFAAHRAALGLGDATSSVGLPEREDPATSRAVAIDPLLAYLQTVFDATSAWLADVGTLALDTVPDTGERLATKADLSVDEVDWLHRMWSDKPVWWLVQWPVIGHGHAHVGEAISVRNRMGLSPF
ncbi:MAG TPA: DinB family protein [Propionibacteriaceae bacterium]|nr:DinB family protein [Propionibacteriaceae bacterium]